MSKVILYILNVLYAICGLVMMVEGVCYLIYVLTFTSLRNSNHYKLEWTLQWPQFLPYIFCFVGIFIIFVSCCGCLGTKKHNQGFTIMHAIFTLLTIAVAIAAAIFAMVYGDDEDSHKFFADTLYDGLSEAKTYPEKSESFSNIESWLQCCGVDSPNNYKGTRATLPKSCCGFDANSSLVCEFTSKEANERHGCAAVVVFYSTLAMYIFAATAGLTAFFGLLNMIASLSLGIRKRGPAVYDATDIETKKGLL